MSTQSKESSAVACPLLAVGKVEATLMAKLALRGHAVHRTVDGGYLVCRHGYVKHCADLEALESFAKQTGAMR